MKFLKYLWSGWLSIARRIGVFESRVILTVFYFTILLPFGVIFSVLIDPLGMKNPKRTAWINRDLSADTGPKLSDQF